MDLREVDLTHRMEAFSETTGRLFHVSPWNQQDVQFQSDRPPCSFNAAAAATAADAAAVVTVNQQRLSGCCTAKHRPRNPTGFSIKDALPGLSEVLCVRQGEST